jgi:hypothetical protein
MWCTRAMPGRTDEHVRIDGGGGVVGLGPRERLFKGKETMKVE